MKLYIMMTHDDYTPDTDIHTNNKRTTIFNNTTRAVERGENFYLQSETELKLISKI